MPARSASSRRAAASARSSSVVAARVAVDRDADPARRVRRARHPRGELLGAVAGEHQVRVAVDEAGDHAAAAGVDPLVGGRARRLDRRDPPALDHERGVADNAERPVPERRIVRDEQADVVDDQRAHGAPPIAGQLARDVERDVPPSRTIEPAADDHVAARRRRRRRTPAASISCSSLGIPASRTLSMRDGDEVGQRARLESRRPPASRGSA